MYGMSYEFPSVMAPDKFKAFLKKLKGIGVPAKFDSKSLESMGYTSSHDQKFLNVLKFIGLLENKRGGAPTDLWKEMRGNSRTAIAKGVRLGYADLFSMYPDAHLRDSEALTSYFATNSSASKDAVQRIVTTFLTLCSLGDFSTDPISSGGKSEVKPTSQQGIGVGHLNSGGSGAVAPVININIQMQLPPDATGEIYEKFFEAMKAKLLS
jgi:hypothetical protein